MRQRLKGVAIAAADARGAIDQFAHRPGDGAGKHQTDESGREDDDEAGKDELAAFLIEMIEDVTRRPRCVDNASNTVVDDDRHRREHVNADATADRVNRRWGFVRDTNAQDRAILS